MFLKFLYIILIFSFYFSSVNASNFIDRTLDWYKIKIIKYDTKSTDFIFKIWLRENYNAINLRTIMEENNGIDAINGTYFCPADYKECWWSDFTANERYVNFQKKWTEQTTGDRVVFAINKNNKPFLYQSNKINSDLESDIKTGLANFPLILQDWKDATSYYVEAWLIDAKMKAKIPRNFICSDKEKRYIYSGYAYDIELLKLPELLLKLGCYDALNLDAWASSAMIYNAKYIIWPGRNILDSIIIERKWLDTKILRENIVKQISLFELNITEKSFDEKIKLLDKISSQLIKKRTQIYNKNSIDLFDENWRKVWYEITANSIKTLSNLYIINYLDKLIYEFKNKYISLNKIELEEKQKEINIQNWLF